VGQDDLGGGEGRKVDELDGSEPPERGLFGLGDSPADAQVVVVPVPWEATTTGGQGTAAGPDAILAASSQVDLFDVELGEPWRAGIAQAPVLAGLERQARRARDHGQVVIDAFDQGRPTADVAAAVARTNDLSQWLTDQIEAEVDRWLEAGKLVAVVGGDHSVALGSLAAHGARYPGLGVLQFDAHADLRVAYQGLTGSHASVMHRVMDDLPQVSKLVSVGLRDLCLQEHRRIVDSGGRIVAFFDADIATRVLKGDPFSAIAEQIADELPTQVYVTFDIDALEPSLCPHTGTPVPGGLSYHQALAVLDALCRTGHRIVGFDLCEVAPGPEGRAWDASVGARLLYKLIGYALRSQRS
jgi:agmatinase